MQEIVKEMEQLGIEIASITETKKKGSGSEIVGNYLHFYSGIPKDNRAKRGVALLIHKKWKHVITNWQCTDERIITMNINILKTRFTVIGVYGPNEDEPVVNKDLFYETLQRVITDFGNKRELVLIGDFNAHTGHSTDSPIIGSFGEEESNDNGTRLIDLCEQNNLKIANGFFQHKDIHTFTWTQNTRNLKSIIDYVIVRQDSQMKTTNVRVHRGPCCGTDHYLVKAIFYVPPRQITGKIERCKEELSEMQHDKV
jgi:exonuclease III